MDTPQHSIDKLLNDMRERAKELNCLYQVEELLTKTHLPLAEIFTQIIQTVPAGFQFPEICQVRIIYEGAVFASPHFKDSPRAQSVDIRVEDKVVGRIEVSYTADVPQTEGSYFLKEEHKLLTTIAERIGRTVLHLKLEQVSREWATAQRDLSDKNKKEWMVVIDLLRRTDQNLYVHLGRKMVYHLFWNGVMEAKELLKTLSKDRDEAQSELSDDMNRPSQRRSQLELLALSDETFRIAARYLTDKEILGRIQKWIQEDKASLEIINAITHYQYISGGNYELSPPMEKGLRVSLIRRFFSDDLEFINIAKNHIEVRHFYDLVQRII
ncbi:MAG: hypothetical protein MUF02_04990 [Acidobacteria bacterium]|nr:hypothetical protein [Acidobacteriota bacterium]